MLLFPIFSVYLALYCQASDCSCQRLDFLRVFSFFFFLIFSYFSPYWRGSFSLFFLLSEFLLLPLIESCVGGDHTPRKRCIHWTDCTILRAFMSMVLANGVFVLCCRAVLSLAECFPFFFTMEICACFLPLLFVVCSSFLSL